MATTFQMKIGNLIPEEEHLNLSPHKHDPQDHTEGKIHSENIIRNSSSSVFKVLFALLIAGLLIYAWKEASQFITQVKESMRTGQETDVLIDKIVEIKIKENSNILKYEEMVKDIKEEREKNEETLKKIVQLQKSMNNQDKSSQGFQDMQFTFATNQEKSSATPIQIEIPKQINNLKKSLVQIRQKQDALFKLVSVVNAELDKHTSNEQKIISQFSYLAKKSEYMTPELYSIQQKRTQKGGILKTGNGTVSELDFDRINSKGERIEQVLYKTAEEIKARSQYHNQRKNTLSSISEERYRKTFSLVNYNMKINSYKSPQIDEDLQWSYTNDRVIHYFDTTDTEMPICVLAPGFNNNKNSRIQYNLNSLFSQNYTNYFIVIINDASTDGSDEVFRKYLQFHNISKERYVYIENKKRKTALENIYIACYQYCSEDSIVTIVDGDDELIGRNVFKSFNAGYQRLKSGVLYSNFFWYDHIGTKVMLGFTEQYSATQKNQSGYRYADQKFSQLRSFRNMLFRKINETDLTNENGTFFTVAYDMAIFFPMMELSCGRVNKIQGHHYLYNINTGMNDYFLDRTGQVAVDKKIRGSKKYQCDEDFELMD